MSLRRAGFMRMGISKLRSFIGATSGGKAPPARTRQAIVQTPVAITAPSPWEPRSRRAQVYGRNPTGGATRASAVAIRSVRTEGNLERDLRDGHKLAERGV